MNKNNKDFFEIQDKLRNHTEDIVLETMKTLLTKNKFKNICTCEQCLLDIASYALNRLPTKYIASPEGDLHTKIAEFENQVDVDAIATVTKAIKIINEKPRH